MLNKIFCLIDLFLPCLILLFNSQTLAHQNTIQRNRCELKLVADYEFYRVIGNHNYANAARYIINLVERVNGIYTSVDWGLDIYGNRLLNLGFIIKEIKILDVPNNSTTHFNSYLQKERNAIDLLKSFSSNEGSNSTCLTILITAKSLQSDVLGLANIGFEGQRGICAARQINGTFMNTALITVKRRSELMITRVVDLVLAHELGHSWGSLHDDPHDEECVPQNSRDGRFVMWESSNTGYDKNNYNFSPCSIRAIQRVLYPIAHHCFVEEKGALCGNGILEEGEECDSGAQLNFGEDSCCTSQCKLNIGALCSPRHSECCSKNCTFMPLGTLCQMANNDTCKDNSVCNGISDKCPEPNYLKDGTNCTDEGKCTHGECIPFCRSISHNLMPCLCEDAAIACRRCCRSIKTGICLPVKMEPIKWLPDNSMCIYGQCNAGICEKKATDSFFGRFLDNFKGPTHRKFFADYIVFIVVLITLLFWIPCGIMIFCKDEQKNKNIANQRAAVQQRYVQIQREPKRVNLHRGRSINDKSQSINGRVNSSNEKENLAVHLNTTMVNRRQHIAQNNDRSPPLNDNDIDETQM